MNNWKGIDMAVKNDYKCDKHGYFESYKPQCPMKGCTDEVYVVFLQAPNLVSAKTRFTDKSTKQLAIEFGMSDIKTTREGEHQEGFLTKKNKFTEKEYEQAEKFATRKKGVDKDKLKPASLPPPPQAPKEARPGDSALWGGGFQGLNMQSLLTGRGIQPVRDEQVGLTPSQAGINSGPKIDPSSTLRDPDNLTIKKWEYRQTPTSVRIFTSN